MRQTCKHHQAFAPMRRQYAAPQTQNRVDDKTGGGRTRTVCIACRRSAQILRRSAGPPARLVSQRSMKHDPNASALDNANETTLDSMDGALRTARWTAAL